MIERNVITGINQQISSYIIRRINLESVRGNTGYERQITNDTNLVSFGAFPALKLLSCLINWQIYSDINAINMLCSVKVQRMNPNYTVILNSVCLNDVYGKKIRNKYLITINIIIRKNIFM